MTKRSTNAIDPQADVEPLVIDPTDWDPRKAAFGTPIGFPDPSKDYPTDGSTPYPPPTP